MKKGNSDISVVTLAVIGNKMDNLTTKVMEYHSELKEHIIKDELNLRELNGKLEPLKMFRWKVYGAIGAVTALIGLVELFHNLGLIH